MTSKAPEARTRMTKAGVVGFAAAMAAVVTLSIAAYANSLPHAPGVRHFDKGCHFFLAGALAFFLDQALGGRRVWESQRAVPWSALILVPIGAEEFLQRLSPVRTSDFYDFVADAAGVLVGICFARFLGRRR